MRTGILVRAIHVLAYPQLGQAQFSASSMIQKMETMLELVENWSSTSHGST
jgi:hypothetical protein